MMFVSRYETRNLGLFFLFDTQREQFTRADVFNLKRKHEFSGYPVYWAGQIGNQESVNYLKSIIDSASVLGQTGDERAVALFRELLDK